MVFFDVNSFLSPRGGGARTYHIKKSDWFARCSDHEYQILGPGEGRGTLELCPSCRPIRTGWGVPYGRKKNYRVLLDFREADRIVAEKSPAVVEIGDPWLSARWGGRLPRKILRTAFWHSDPHTAYLEPLVRAGRPWLRPFADRILSTVDSWHKGFDLIWCASEWVADLLRRRGYPNVEIIQFGIDRELFHPRPRVPAMLERFGLDPTRPTVLYTGRLDFEKDVHVLFASLPGLLALESAPQVLVTGRGEWEDRFAAFRAPGYAYGGFLENRDEVADLVASCDLLLATCPVETFGLSVLEGICSGRGVVSADGGGGAEQVRQSGAGELFASGSVTEFVKAVERALPKADEYAARARAWGAAWPTWDDMFSRQNRRCLELLDARR